MRDDDTVLPEHVDPDPAGTMRLVRELVADAERLRAEARASHQVAVDASDRRLVEAGRVIFDRKFGGSEARYRRYGGQGPVLEEVAEVVHRSQGAVRNWIDAAIVSEKLENELPANPQTSENLALSVLVQLARLDEIPARQLELGRRARDEGWSESRMRQRVNSELGHVPKPRKASSGSTLPELGPLPARTTAEDLAALDVLHQLLARRPADAAVLLLLDWFDRLAGRRHIEWSAELAADHVARLGRELDRVYNRENRRRRGGARTPPFAVEHAPAGLVRITQGPDWSRSCDPRVLYALLAAVPTAMSLLGGQRLVATESGRGPLVAKMRDVRAVVERAATEYAEPEESQ